MYPPHTVLTRIEPRNIELQSAVPGEPPTEAPDPMNVIKVVGASPIKKASREEWSGAAGDHVIVTPVEEFGANEVIPMAILQGSYEITEYGGDEAQRKIVLDPTTRPSMAHAASPEDQFAAFARDEQKEATKAKGRKPNA